MGDGLTHSFTDFVSVFFRVNPWPIPFHWQPDDPTQETTMAQIQLDAPAPDFTLADYRGNPVSLADFRGRQHVLLVFNRGFM